MTRLVLIIAVVGLSCGPAPAKVLEPSLLAVLPPLPAGVSAIDGTSTSLGDADLALFAAAVQGKQLVGLGESVHGIETYAELRERLVRYLVTEQGFRAVSFEGGWYTSEQTRAWVEADQGTLDQAMMGLTFLAWDTRPMARLLVWLHDYNLAHRGDPVRIFGADAQASGDAAGLLRAALTGADVGTALTTGMASCYCGAYDSTAACSAHPEELNLLYGNAAGSLSQARREACLAAAKTISAYLVANRDALEGSLGAERFLELTLAAQDLTAYTDEAFFTWHSSPIDLPTAYSVRDRAWASHFLALRAARAPNAKTVIWAHDYHLSKAPALASRLLMWDRTALQSVTTFGAEVRAAAGPQYAAFGFFALHQRYDSDGRTVSEVPPRAGAGAGEAMLEALGRASLFVPLPSDLFPAGRQWSFGNDFDLYAPADEFDGVFYFQDTSPSQFYVFGSGVP